MNVDHIRGSHKLVFKQVNNKMGEKPHFYLPCLHRWELSSSSALWFSAKHKKYVPRTKSMGIMFILWKDYFRVLVDSMETP